MFQKTQPCNNLTDFDVNIFDYQEYSYPIYRKGVGPAVIIIHEIPTITLEVINFARRVADAGFTVFMPHLFGVAGAPFSYSSAVKQLAISCIRKEFSVFSANQSSPITNYLRALSQQIHNELNGAVGVVGMCLTGNFALALAVDTWVTAPVLSQPSLPFGINKTLKSALHISPADIAVLQARVKQEELTFLALKFSHDALCPNARFATLRQTFGTAVEEIIIDSGLGNTHRISPTAHSVLTTDFIDKAGHPTKIAMDRVLEYFKEKLVLANP